MLGLEIERALDAEQPDVEQPLGRVAEPLEEREQGLDLRGVDLVARAPHEVQRLGRDVSIRAGDRRRRHRRLRDVLDQRHAEGEHGAGGVRVAIARGRDEHGPPLLRERVGGAERALLGAGEAREDRRRGALRGGQGGDQIGDPDRI